MSVDPSAAAAAGAAAVADLPTPPLPRRLLCMVYEGLLLFGVLMAAAALYSGLTHMRHALHGRFGLQVFLFIVLALYFVWFWTHGGQTVAMKAWRIRLVDARGGPLTRARAFARYLLAWLWFMPALLAVDWSGLKGGWAIGTLLLAGMAAYAALTRLLPQRQFWHDVVCATRLVDERRRAPP